MRPPRTVTVSTANLLTVDQCVAQPAEPGFLTLLAFREIDNRARMRPIAKAHLKAIKRLKA